MSLDLNKLSNKIDEALSNETSETLTKFLNDKTMSNNKQSSNHVPDVRKMVSSVEWLIKKLTNRQNGVFDGLPHLSVDDIFKQAKAMHKDEIIQAYSNGWHDGQDAIIMKIEHIDKGGDERGLKYYEQQ